MPDTRTKVTELATALGTLGFDSVDEALSKRPSAMVSVSPELWAELTRISSGGAFESEFNSAFENGRAFLAANEGLRSRTPIVVEWKGNQKNPGDDSLPVDLRIDHVYLISCKYDSKILHNRSPASVFDNALRPTTDVARGNWFIDTAQFEFQTLYEAVVDYFQVQQFPRNLVELSKSQRDCLKAHLALKTWPPELAPLYGALCKKVASESAKRWSASSPNLNAKDQLLRRVLRFGQAPHFVLGSSKFGPMRFRISTPWDWRQAFELKAMSFTPAIAGQPRVDWHAEVKNLNTGGIEDVKGYVEIRWSHGRFSGAPEAKIYLDTPHHSVPGYFVLR